jgi:c-di-GMP-binding flagellar brake protein YcgR
MLGHLAERDGAVELSRGVSQDDTTNIIYRSRVFEVRPDGSIIVEKPPQAAQDQAFRFGDDIDLTLMLNNERMVATCTLQEQFSYSVNNHLRVTCYRLSPGRRPMREQRRSTYRVNVAAMNIKPGKLIGEVEDHPFECDIHIVNISAGGIGVSIRAERRLLNQIKRTRQFRCTTSLGHDEQLDIPVSVQHIGAIGEDGLYLGLKFEIANEQEAMQHERFVQQRCTEIQRMQLSRRRA